MIQCAAIFKDHCVLQRNKPVPVWGTADEGSIRVSLREGDKILSAQWAKCGGEGVFWGLLPQMPAGGPYLLVIERFLRDKEVKQSEVASAEAESTGGALNKSLETPTETPVETCIFSDVYLGEVWLAGGQSNMELELQNSKNGQKIVASTDNPLIRFYYTPKIAWVGEELLEAEKHTGWQLCKPGQTSAWSAVGYYFAKELAEKLGVMIGVIGCNWGGTSAASWTSKEALSLQDELSGYLTEYDAAMEGKNMEQYLQEWEAYNIYQAAFDKNVGEYYRTNPNPTWEEAISLFGENQYPGPMGPRNWTRPCGLYESMLSRITPYALAGVIFYQGEEDDNRPYAYKTLLKTMIRNWREDFCEKYLPFFLVQLPIFRNEGEIEDCNWPFIREAQMDVSCELPSVGTAVTLDVGEFHNIHPLDKETVGKRLSLQALYFLYQIGDLEQIMGPVFDQAQPQGGKIVLSFEHAKEGFDFSGIDLENASEELGFEIAGEDNVYVPAKVEPGLFRNMLELSSDSVKYPVKARYFWKNYGTVSVFGRNGIPLAPFRTDRYDGAVANGSRQGKLK